MLVKISNVYQISLDSLLREDQKLKDYLEQGRAMNSFSVSYGFIWIMFGLSYLLDDSTKVGSIAWDGMAAIFILTMIYEEMVVLFSSGSIVGHFIGVVNGLTKNYQSLRNYSTEYLF